MLTVLCGFFIVVGAFGVVVNLSIFLRLPHARVPAWRALIPLEIPDGVSEENLRSAVTLRSEACHIVEGVIVAGSPATSQEDKRLDELAAEINRLLSRP